MTIVLSLHGFVSPCCSYRWENPLYTNTTSKTPWMTSSQNDSVICTQPCTTAHEYATLEEPSEHHPVMETYYSGILNGYSVLHDDHHYSMPCHSIGMEKGSK